MKLVGYEFKKLQTKNLFLMCLLLFIVLNLLVLFYVQSNDKSTSSISNNIKYYNNIINEIRELPEKEQSEKANDLLTIIDIALEIDSLSQKENADDVEFSESIIEDYKSKKPLEYEKATKINCSRTQLLNMRTCVDSIVEQIEYFNSYSDYINHMQERSDQQTKFSIFSKKDSFSYNNMKKTPQDFSNLNGLKQEIGNNLFVENATTFVLTDLLVFALVFLMCVYVFTFERDRELYTLIRTTKKGNLQLIISKLVVVILFTVVISVVYYTSNIVISGLYSGFGDMSRNIQSIKLFMNCNLKLQIWQYLILWICSKIVTMCAISVILSLIFVCIKNTSMIFAVTSLCLLVEWLLYFTIGPNTSYNQLKYINIIYFLLGNNLFGNYLNIDILSYPVNIAKIYFILIPVILIGLIVLTCWIFVKQNQISSKGFIDLLLKKISMYFGRVSDGTSLFRGECFKHYKGSMAVLALVLLAFVAYSNLNDDITVVYSSAQESAYSSYLNVLEGPFTQDKEKYLSEQQQYFDGLNEKIGSILSNSSLSSEEKEMKTAAIQSILETKGAAFDEIIEQRNYIKEKGEELDLIPQFINKTVYKRLVENSQREWDLFFLLMVVVIFISSNVFAYEHKKQMTNLIRCNRNGKFKLVITKIAVALITTVFSFVLVYLPYYINFIKTFGTVSLDSPIVFIQDFSGVNSPISVNETIFLISIVHFFFALMTAMLVMMFSQFFKNNSISMIVPSVLILFPSILCMNISEIRLYTAFQNGVWIILVPIMLIVSIIVFILCFVMTYISFSKENIKLFGRIKNAYA